jgi:eukaryotic-like serine/threonine-protein kinase
VSTVKYSETCDETRLAKYLDGSMSSAEQLQFETHLNDCSLCRHGLEAMAAERDWWTTASQALTELADGSGSTVIEPSTADCHPNLLSGWLARTSRRDSLGSLGLYDILGVLGQGGMGLVLHGFDTELNRPVAIKTLPNCLAFSEDARLRFQREARAAANLSHPNLVPIYGTDSWKGVPYIVMPLIEGGTLENYTAQHKLNMEQILNVALQVAKGLAEMHSIGLVHRDVKPSNVLLRNGPEHVMLSDFGLARFHNDDKLTSSNVLPGTPHFMSPEQALGADVDAKSDLFSLGCLMYWMCAEKPPFAGRSNYETLSALVHSQPSDLSIIGVPNYVVLLIVGLMQKNPSARWTDARKVTELLDACLKHANSPALHSLPAELAEPRHGSNGDFPIPLAKLAVRGSLVGAVVIAVCALLYQRESNTAGPLTERYGILDAFDQRTMLDELSKSRNLHYWLRRLAYLDVSEIPADSIELVQRLITHSDPTTRELAQVILNKNPFQAVDRIEGLDRDAPEIVSNDSDDNPFILMIENEQAQPNRP